MFITNLSLYGTWVNGEDIGREGVKVLLASKDEIAVQRPEMKLYKVSLPEDEDTDQEKFPMEIRRK